MDVEHDGARPETRSRSRSHNQGLWACLQEWSRKNGCRKLELASLDFRTCPSYAKSTLEDIQNRLDVKAEHRYDPYRLDMSIDAAHGSITLFETKM